MDHRYYFNYHLVRGSKVTYLQHDEVDSVKWNNDQIVVFCLGKDRAAEIASRYAPGEWERVPVPCRICDDVHYALVH